MTPYENYLLNDFKPYTMQDNPFQAGSYRTMYEKVPNTEAVNELANKPAYNARGERYGSTLSDDMFDIKNKKRENSRHAWNGTPYPLTATEDIPVLKESNPVEDYLAANPYLTAEDYRGNAFGRKKNVGEGYGALFRDQQAYEAGDVLDSELESYLSDMTYYQMLKDQIEGLGTESIADDMRYIKSGGDTYHSPGSMNPRWDAEYEPTVGTDVNLERLSPETLRLLAQMGERPSTVGVDPETETLIQSELNALINGYRRRNE